MSNFDEYLKDIDSLLFNSENREEIQEYLDNCTGSDVTVVHTEWLTPQVARQILGGQYKADCTYQLITSTEGVFVQQCNPKGNKELTDNPNGYLYTIKLDSSDDECMSYTEMMEKVQSDTTMINSSTPHSVFRESYEYDRHKSVSWIVVPVFILVLSLIVGIVLFCYLL